MKMLRHKKTGQEFIWTPYLAMNSDLEEFATNGDATPAPPPPKSHITGGLAAALSATPSATAAPSPTETPPPVNNVYEITDKARLRAMLAERNVVVAGNPSLKTLQDRLAAALEE
jgi:hypothetical protein